MTNIPTYPEIRFVPSMSGAKIVTNIRKLNRGKWYLWTVVSSGTTVAGAFESFTDQCYKIICFGVVSTSLKNMDGEFLFKLDPDQRNEKTRLLNLIK